jgi:hypothetical protein
MLVSMYLVGAGVEVTATVEECGLGVGGVVLDAGVAVAITTSYPSVVT